MKKIPRVITDVVDQDLCTGCGACVYQCPSNALGMTWSDTGFLIPKVQGTCESDGACLQACPFNPYPDEAVEDEDKIAAVCLQDAPQYNKRLGRYTGLYAGYSKEFRHTSSSGGLATYVLDQLLMRGLVDHVFSVKESESPDAHYQYTVTSRRTDLLSASKTRYFPVTMASVLPELDKLEGKVAVVGVACFLKSIRLAQHYKPELRNKIPFTIGIFCGGLKSSFYTEYLAEKTGTDVHSIGSPEYRVKDANSAALDYSFSCMDKNVGNIKSVKMKPLGDMWGTGFFKANACDFCDDVTSELADISLGDAWIDPYKKDGLGTSIVITRTDIADQIISEGLSKGELVLDIIPAETAINSQQGGFNHRQDAQSIRVRKAIADGVRLPPKRFSGGNVPLDVYFVQHLRRIVRGKTLQLWTIKASAEYLDKHIKKYISQLKLVTRLSRRIRSVSKKIKKIGATK